MIRSFFLSIGFALLRTLELHGQAAIDSAHVFPDPFRQTAVFEFDLPTDDTGSLALFDVTGQSVLTLFGAVLLPAGGYAVDIVGDSLAAGVYSFKLNYGVDQENIVLVVKQCGTTGFAPHGADNGGTFYPNPASNSLTVPVDGAKRIVLTNTQGKTCAVFTTTEQTIALNALNNGGH
ncbi:MAG TPA: hypothetical protein VEY71_08365 [Chitinophagales bacterium]|nr:hypothetical protein [Chitinophagales bacterium]